MPRRKACQVTVLTEHNIRSMDSSSTAVGREQHRFETSFVHPGTPAEEALASRLKKPLGREYSALELLRRPELRYQDIQRALHAEHGDCEPVDMQVAEQVEIQAKYAGYIDRQQEEIERLRRHENVLLPEELDYDDIDGLSNEVKQKLAEARPQTLARAGRIPGITPAAVSLLLIHLKKRGALDRRIA